MNKLELLHFALVNREESAADKFYTEALNMKREYDFEVPSKLTKKFFRLPEAVKVIVYGNEEIYFEIIIIKDYVIPEISAPHICFTVDNLGKFKEKIKKKEIEMVSDKNSKGDELLFIKDYTGNLFEIKEKIIDEKEETIKVSLNLPVDFINTLKIYCDNQNSDSISEGLLKMIEELSGQRNWENILLRLIGKEVFDNSE